MRTIDINTSDCVQYMLHQFPLPQPVYSMPPFVKEKLAEKKKAGNSDKLEVCIYGYSNLAGDIIDSLWTDDELKVHLVTKSIVESQRAEIDGKTAIELS